MARTLLQSGVRCRDRHVQRCDSFDPEPHVVAIVFAAIAYYRDSFGCEFDHREVVERDGVEEAPLRVADSYVAALMVTLGSLVLRAWLVVRSARRANLER